MKGKKVKVALYGSPYFGMTGWVVDVRHGNGGVANVVDFGKSVAVFTSDALSVVEIRKARKDDRNKK